MNQNDITSVNEIINSDFSYIMKILSKYNIHTSWYELFISLRKKLTKILKHIEIERLNNIVIFPEDSNMFKVFTKDINDIKIVLLGQDPYIKIGQAMGLSFSVPKNNIKIPPSLLNIYKELKLEFPERDYNFTQGDLTNWFNKGIFLLNSALTVIEGKSNSQQNLWSWFTDLTIQYINQKQSNIVFLLLGNYAINKSKYISENNHNHNHIITGIHPSPLSANIKDGFFNSGIFRKVEEKLGEQFDWSL
jgi:uracil-DNA glycosylase